MNQGGRARWPTNSFFGSFAAAQATFTKLEHDLTYLYVMCVPSRPRGTYFTPLPIRMSAWQPNHAYVARVPLTDPLLGGSDTQRSVARSGS